MAALEIVFLTGTAVVLYTYIGYGIVVRLLIYLKRFLKH